MMSHYNNKIKDLLMIRGLSQTDRQIYKQIVSIQNDPSDRNLSGKKEKNLCKFGQIWLFNALTVKLVSLI